ncbi:MAG: hypothetical protein QGG96_01540 [Candidatus Poseidoniaceae archaeon]|nr:hypothetical protein [Candidatus Poseidoniaceae archaeon]
MVVEEEEEVLDKNAERERLLYGIDRQFISEGMRLILLLPGTALIFLFCSWAYMDDSPAWWANNIQQTSGLDFSKALTFVTLAIILGFTLGLLVHRERSRYTRLVFKEEVKLAADNHRPITSMHGFPTIERLMSRTMSSHSTALYMAITSLIISIGIVLLESNSSLAQKGLLASSSLITMAMGQHLSTRSSKFHMVERDGLLSAYDSPLHPTTLDMVFTELMGTHMDPLLRSRFEDFLVEFDGYLRDGIDYEFAREKFLMTMHRRYKGSIGKETTHLELSEIMSDEGVQAVTSHPIFTEELWNSLIEKSNGTCRAFFRLIDRLEQDLSVGKTPDMEDLLFDVDLENVVTDRANLFCYFHNLSDKPKQVILRVQSPDFRPHDISLRYNLLPGEKNWWPTSAVPIASEGDDDQIGRMAGLLRDGTVSWQTLLPESTGEASVAIRLEETSGDLLVGRQISVRVRSEFRSWLRNTGAISCLFLGGIGLATAIVLQVLSVLAVA